MVLLLLTLFNWKNTDNSHKPLHLPMRLHIQNSPRTGAICPTFSLTQSSIDVLVPCFLGERLHEALIFSLQSLRHGLASGLISQKSEGVSLVRTFVHLHGTSSSMFQKG